MPKTGVSSKQISDEQVKRDDLNISQPGQAVTRKIVAGSGISITSTGADAGTGDVTISASTPERALVMGKAGALVNMTNAADFLVIVPFAMTLRRMKGSVKVASSANWTVQIRRSTDGGSTWSDFFGVLSFSSGNLLAQTDPADAAVSEGDLLNFTVASSSGATNLLVELIGA